MTDTEQEIAELKSQVEALKKTLGMFITWTAQSSISPINPAEAALLLESLEDSL